MRRIDLFLPPGSPFGTLTHLTERLAESLMEEGVACRVLEAERYNPAPFVDKLFSDPPDFTLSFNGLLPDPEGRFFSDLIEIPHLAFVLDPPTRFAALVENDRTFLACSDQKSVDFFHSLSQGEKNPLFLLPGVEKELVEEEKESQKGYDLVFFGTIRDPDILKIQATNQLSPLCNLAISEAAEALSKDPNLWYIDAFVEAIARNEKPDLSPESQDFLLALYFLEELVTAEARISLLKKFSSFQCDVFASPHSLIPKSLEKLSHLHFHDPVPFEQMLEIQQRSKGILQACPILRYGASERIFYSLASGAVVISESTPFLKDHFKNGEDLFLLDATDDFKEVEENIRTVLESDKKRQDMAKSSEEKLMKHHTWNCRARELIEYLSQVTKLPRSLR